LTHAINNGEHNFYDTTKKQLLPAYGMFIYTLYAHVYNLDLSAYATDHARAEAVIRHATAEENSRYIDALSPSRLHASIDESLSREHYQEETRRYLAALKSNLIMLPHAPLNAIYESLSLLCALKALPFPRMLSLFMSGTDAINPESYDACPGEDALEDIGILANTVHQFSAIEVVDDVIEIIGAHNSPQILNHDSLRDAIQKLAAVVNDNILFYIIAHIEKKPPRDTFIVQFNSNFINPYLSHLKKNIDLIERKYIEQHREDFIKYINTSLFEPFPNVALTYYTNTHRRILAECNIYTFRYIDVIEKILTFIEHVFSNAITHKLQMTLFLHAAWTTSDEREQFLQIMSDIKELKREIINIDEEIPILFHTSEPFDKLLGSLNMFSEVDRRVTMQRLAFIDERFSEIIVIFQGMLRDATTATRKLADDRSSQRGEFIKNWSRLENIDPGLEQKLMRAITIFSEFSTLIETMYAIVSDNE